MLSGWHAMRRPTVLLDFHIRFRNVTFAQLRVSDIEASLRGLGDMFLTIRRASLSQDSLQAARQCCPEVRMKTSFEGTQPDFNDN